MSAPPAGIPEANWLATPASVRTLILAQQQEIQALRQENEERRVQLTALATELSELRERIGRSSRNSSKPPSSDGPGFKPPERRKGSGRKRGGQPGHPGSGPELLPIERVDEVVEHHPDACRRCGTLLEGEDPEPLRHQVIESPPITLLVIEHRLHRLVCPCCSTSTCATLPADVEASHYGPRLSALVGLLGSAFPLSFSKTQALLDQLLGVEISCGAIATIRQRLSAVLEQPMQEALAFARQQPVAYVDETGAPTGNADGCNPDRKRGWQWVMVTAVVTVFIQGLSRSTAAAIELLGNAFGGIVVSDRFSAYNHLPTQQRQLCWAHLIRDLVAIAERRAPALSSARSCWACSSSCLATGTVQGRHDRLARLATKLPADPPGVCGESAAGGGAGLPTRRANAVGEHGAHLPAAPEGGRWVVDLSGDRGDRAHQQCCRASPAPVGDSAQDQSRSPITPRCDLPQPPAHGHHHPQATGPRCLAVP
jgi:transposase